ncbi:MAG: paraquat-inducible protein A [Betaproteobacteria bacterium]|nr:MAG: paraquat-inducible protein A [Betaproteobacteria bacterium]
MRIAIVCTTCGWLQRLPALEAGDAADCGRCGSPLRARRAHGGLERTAALTLAALILFVPANAYPILRMQFHGAYSESTVWDGCVKLMQQGQWFVAAIVFLASIAIPLVKLLGLFYLVVSARLGSTRLLPEKTWFYRLIEVIGPWAMLDVFLLAVLVALVKLDQIATVLPGPGLLAFTTVVLLTILASAAFDPKLLWEKAGRA